MMVQSSNHLGLEPVLRCEKVILREKLVESESLFITAEVDKSTLSRQNVVSEAISVLPGDIFGPKKLS